MVTKNSFLKPFFTFVLLLLCTVVAESQSTSVVPSNRNGNITVDNSALPVTKNSASETAAETGKQLRKNSYSLVSKKPTDSPLYPSNYFCSTPNAARRGRLDSDLKAVGGLDCGTIGRSSCYWSKPFIFIGFINGTPELKDVVRRSIDEWTMYANVAFIDNDNANYTTDQADIKIFFTPQTVYSSAVGVDSWRDFFRTSKDTPTMKLGFIDQVVKNQDGSIVPWVRGTILHEFGHALGLKHEHQNPVGGLQWNREVVVRELSGPPNNWTVDIIEHNIFRALDRNLNQFTQYDPSSIMHYPFPASWTTKGVEIFENFELSETDKNFIAQKYPRRKSTINPNGYFRLTTWYNNQQNCLDLGASNDPSNKTYFPIYVACNKNSSGQLWKFTPTGNGDYRLTNFLTGANLSLTDTGLSNLSVMNPSGNYSGQIWTVTSLGKYQRLTSAQNGIYQSLTANPQPNTRLYMTKTGHWSNQLWELIPAAVK